MEKSLISEIKRMKEIMGLTLLSEGIDDLVKKVLGMSDEGATTIKNLADQTDEYSNALKSVVGGTGSYDDILSYVGGKIRKSSPTVDEIATYIKSDKELLKKLALGSDAIMKNAADDIFAKADIQNILTPTSYSYVDGLINVKLTANNSQFVSDFIDDALAVLEPKLGQNTELDNLIKQLQERQKIANNLKTGLDAPTPSRFSFGNTNKPPVVDDSVSKYVKGNDPDFDNVLEMAKAESPVKLSPEKQAIVDNFAYTLYKGIDGEINANKFIDDIKKRMDEIYKGADEATKRKIGKLRKILNKIGDSCGITKFTWKTFIVAPGCAVGFIGVISAASFLGDYSDVIDNKLWTKLPCSMMAFLDIPEAWDIVESDFYKDLCNGQEWWKSEETAEGGKTASDAYNAVVANDPNLEGLTIDEKTWKLESSDNGVEIYNANMSDGSSYTFQWDGNVWTIL
jgi:hypothetical protein